MPNNDPSISDYQSPEQKAVFQALQPLINRLGGVAQGNDQYISGYEPKREWVEGTVPQATIGGRDVNREFTGGSPGYWKEWDEPIYSDTPDRLMDTPSAPRVGQNYMTYQDYFAQNGPQGGYTPPAAVQPSADWYNNLSPDVMAGLNAPWNDARNQMFETMGSNLGSPRGGWSGVGAAALGEFESNRATQVPMQAWAMSQPGLQAQWGAQNQANFGDYVSGVNRTGQDYGSYVQGIQQDYGDAMNQAQMPWSIMPGLLGGTYSSPVVNPGGPGAATYAGTGLMAAGSVPSPASPYLLGAGALMNMYGQFG